MDTEPRLKELERRRLRGARLLSGGTHPAEVARQVGVSRQSVMRWERALKENGIQGLERVEAPGRARRLSETQLKELAKVLKAGSLAAGYATEMWTLPRIGALIQERFGVKLAHAAEDGMESTTTGAASSAARRNGDPHVEEQEVGQAKKIAARKRRVIVFIDESGLSERPCRARTWAPRGQTPVLQYSFSWKQLSVIAGLSFWRFYFRFFPGSIKSPQIVEFLKALQATIGRKLLIIWNRLQAHRSRLVRDHVEQQRGKIALEYLPPYAPGLNPVECIWDYLKSHAMPNFCARDLAHLGRQASSRLRSMQCRGTLITAFWKQAELF